MTFSDCYSITLTEEEKRTLYQARKILFNLMYDAFDELRYDKIKAENWWTEEEIEKAHNLLLELVESDFVGYKEERKAN